VDRAGLLPLPKISGVFCYNVCKMSVNFLTGDFFENIKKLERRQKRLFRVSKFFFLTGVVFLFFSFAPSIWYAMASKVDDFSRAILETVNKVSEEEDNVTAVTEEVWQPVYNPKFGPETQLVIPAIKVDTQINEASYETYERALKKGVWRVPDFGTPYDRSKPTILAAHRFGYLSWSNIYRRLNSFYNLPKLKEGDIVEIIYKQRKYTYEVYNQSRGEEITDYSADLILYTCETLNSKVRIFKYAKLLKV